MLNISKNTIQLLEKQAIEELYSLPRLDDQDREATFSLNGEEEAMLAKFHTMQSKVLFILQLGFFRIKKRFYSIEEIEKEEESKRYVIQKYFGSHTSKNLTLHVTKPTRLAHQVNILKLFSYVKYSGRIVIVVEREALRLAQIHSKPSYLVKELLYFLQRKRIIVPAYSTLHNLVGMAVEKTSAKVQMRLDNVLSKEEKHLLDELVVKREKFLHDLTLLKRDPKDFSLTEVKKTIEKKRRIEEYPFTLDNLTDALGISAENILHYASLVSYYKIEQMGRIAPLKKRLLLLCFLHIRYKAINDQLIKAFLYRVNNYIKVAKKNMMQETYLDRIGQNVKLKKAGRLINLFLDQLYLPDDIPFKEVRHKAFSILDKETMALLVKDFTETSVNEKELEWEHIDKLGRSIRMNLRPIVLSLNFDSQPSCIGLIKAVKILKKKLKTGSLSEKIIVPTLFSKSVNKHIYNKGTTVHFRYEFQLYKKIAEKLVSGDIFVKESLSYKSFEQDLIDKESWKNKGKILSSLGLPKLLTPPDVLLKDLDKQLSELYTSVNKSLLNQKNTYIEVYGHRKEKWRVRKYPSKETKRVDIFGGIPSIGISKLLAFANHQTSFTENFTHVLGKRKNKRRNLAALLATITACGTNMGLGKMSRNANVHFEEMQQTYRNFIRPETLKIACDKLINTIKSLPIFARWFIEERKMYSSSDGQKFGVSRSTSNARYSSKYFGLEKGIVSYTLEANYVPINSRIIGANEHESHFVLDILLGNSSEIKPDIHTTDSHGTNRVNFALLYLFDYVFAPRYRDLIEEAKSIYCLSGIEDYKRSKGFIFSPKGMISKTIIEQEWDNILRIMASLATKTTSQSTIVRKLVGFPRKNNTRKALDSLDKIIKSIHILRYIEDLDFRQHIQKSINRGEAYHSLKRAIFYDNQGKFRVLNEPEQNTWSECTRLLALSIIYYNAFLLSNIEHKLSRDNESADFLRQVSPIQWRHVDMYGKFFFEDESNEEGIQEVISTIEEMDFTPFR